MDKNLERTQQLEEELATVRKLNKTLIRVNELLRAGCPDVELKKKIAELKEQYSEYKADAEKRIHDLEQENTELKSIRFVGVPIDEYKEMRRKCDDISEFIGDTITENHVLRLKVKNISNVLRKLFED